MIISSTAVRCALFVIHIMIISHNDCALLALSKRRLNERARVCIPARAAPCRHIQRHILNQHIHKRKSIEVITTTGDFVMVQPASASNQT